MTKRGWRRCSACNLGETDEEDDDEEKRNKQGVMLTCDIEGVGELVMEIMMLDRGKD